MSSITIKKISIIDLDVDCIVNAANSGLQAGSGVCGAIFSAAGHDKLQRACNKIGHCETGSAVITPGFGLKQPYIIHAVGPVWHGGKHGEEKLLYSAYRSALDLAWENNCRSIGFPLISAGIYGYPQKEAWRVALHAASDFLEQKSGEDREFDICFAVLNNEIIQMGQEELAAQLKK